MATLAKDVAATPAFKPVKLVSFGTSPGPDRSGWMLLTGSPDVVRPLARGMHMAGEGGSFVVVDRQGRVRRTVDGLAPEWQTTVRAALEKPLPEAAATTPALGRARDHLAGAREAYARFEDDRALGELARIDALLLDREPSQPVIELLVERNLIRAWSRRFAADVDDRRTVLFHAQGRLDRDLAVVVHAAVGKRVRRDVEDAHDGRCHTSRSRRMRAPSAFSLSSMRS